MAGIVCVGFASAQSFWRGVGRSVAAANPTTDEVPPLLVRIFFLGGKGIDLSEVPERTRANSVPSRVETSGVDALRSDHPELGDVVDVYVSAQAARHSVRSTRVHLMTGAIPLGLSEESGRVRSLQLPSLCFSRQQATLTRTSSWHTATRSAGSTHVRRREAEALSTARRSPRRRRSLRI